MASVLGRNGLSVCGSHRESEGRLRRGADGSILVGAGRGWERRPPTKVVVAWEGRATFAVGEREEGRVLVVSAGVPRGPVERGDGTLRRVYVHAGDGFVAERLEG